MLNVSKRRKNILSSSILLFVGAALFIFSFYADNLSYSAISKAQIKKIESILHEKQQLLENASDEWFRSVLEDSSKIFPGSPIFDELESSRTLFLFGLKNDSIVYWSSSIPVSHVQLATIDTIPRFVKLGSGWRDEYIQSEGEGAYVAQSFRKDQYKVITLLLIGKEYTYQNSFLQSGLNEQLPFPSSSFVSTLSDGGEPIHGKDGQALFGVGLDVINRVQYSFILRWVGMMIMLLAVTLFVAKFRCQKRSLLPLLPFFLCLLLVRFYVVSNISYFESGWQLFSPQLFASSDYYPSLGHLLLDVVLSFLFMAVAYRYRKDIFVYVECCNPFIRVVFCCVLGVVLSFMGIAIHKLFLALIHSSTIPIEPYRLSEINSYTFVAYGLISLAISIFLLAQLLYVKLTARYASKLWLLLPLAGFVVAFLLHIGATSALFFLFFLAACYLFTTLHAWGKLSKAKYMVSLILVVSLYAMAVTAVESESKEKKERRSLAMSLYADRDPVAEVMFKELSNKIKADVVIANAISKDSPDYEAIDQRLRTVYFGGYFKNYDNSLTVCPLGSKLHLSEENREVDCWSFFKEKEKKSGGIAIGAFKLINENNGRINYLGKFEYGVGGQPTAVFIVLTSRLENQILGYPELLLETKEKVSQLSSLKPYSYAKYLDGSLVLSFGSYSYGYELPNFENRSLPTDTTYVANGYNHLLVNYDDNNSLIISLQELNIVDLILSFSYVFLLFFTAISFFMMLGGYRVQLMGKRITFRVRITRILVALLSAFFVATGGSMLWYSMRQFNIGYIASIEDRMEMLVSEFDRFFIDEKSFESQNATNLSYLLIDLSNIYHTDINLYAPNGCLIETSRAEIFDKGLQGQKINPSAFRTLMYGNLSRYVCKERIGSMEYYSAYTPYYNVDNKLLGFINLPSFAKQAEQTKELTSLVIAILNIFLLLSVLGILIAIAISNRLARPLESVRLSMGKLNLSGQSEPIAYNGNDELGDLVREYNRTIEELAKSAQQLAKTERESAWREMARQIAHEIKNPLTPMRLSIQHVARMKKDRVDGWQDKFDSLATTLIEQIDTLADTASEFSSFAKLHVTENSMVDLVLLLREQISLFGGYENIHITLQSFAESVVVSAHREQLQRVFTNLIKNAVQAVEGKKNGVIGIVVEENADTYSISIDDNGVGITEEQQKNLFRPNFTTKSGGTGLGLAISRKIVNAFGGDISYRASKSGGACFTVVLPKPVR